MRRKSIRLIAAVCAASVTLGACMAHGGEKKTKESSAEASFSHTSAAPSEPSETTKASAGGESTDAVSSAAEGGVFGDFDLFGLNAKNDPEKMWDIIPYIDVTPEEEFDYIKITYQENRVGYYSYDMYGADTVVRVVGYKGSSSAVRIPDKIDGCPVVSVDLYHADYDGEQDYGLKEIIVPDTVQFIGVNKDTIEYMNIPSGAYVAMPSLYMLFVTRPFGSLKGLYIDADYFGSVLVDDCPEIKVMRKGRIYTHDNIKEMDSTFTPYLIKKSIEVSYDYDPETNQSFETGEHTDMIISDCLGAAGTLTIPDGVTEIARDAFIGCTELEKIIIPESVVTIRAEAFSGCTSLKSIVIPDSVKTIDCVKMYDLGGPFYGCTSLTDLTIGKGLVVTQKALTEGCNIKTLRLRGENEISEYYSDNNNRLYIRDLFPDVEKLIIEDGVQTLRSDMVPKSENLKEVVLPKTLKTIDDNAFGECTGIRSITIPNSVETLGYCAFSGCTGLTEITVPGSVRTLGVKSFENCTALKDIRLSNGITDINYGAFMGCTAIESIVIPDSVQTIDDAVFSGCTLLKNVKLGRNVRTLGKLADYGSISAYMYSEVYKTGVFEDCVSLERIDIPSSVETLGAHAFKGCTALKELKLHNGLRELGAGVFDGINSVGNIDLPDTVCYAVYDQSDNSLGYGNPILVSKHPSITESYNSAGSDEHYSSGVNTFTITYKGKKYTPDQFEDMCAFISGVDLYVWVDSLTGEIH